MRLHRQQAAILAPFLDLAAPDALLQQDRIGGVEFLLFDNPQLRLGLADRLLGSPAEQAFRPLVPEADPGVGAGHRDRVLRLVEQRRLYPVTGFGPRAVRFRLLLFGDVDHRADDTGGDALAVADEAAAVAHFRIRTIAAHEAVFVAPVRPLRAQGVEQPAYHALAVIRMQQAGPPADAALEPIGVVAEYAVDAFAPPDAVGHRVPIPDDVGDGAGDDLEALGVLAFGFLQPLAFGDVGAIHRQSLF